MCVVWKYRLAVSITLVFVVCGVHASDGPQPIEKVYSRGNHWAVGHLMGKKSTDEQSRLQDPDGDGVNFIAAVDEYLHQDRNTDPMLLRILEALVREQTEARRASHPRQRLMARGSQRDRQLKQVEELFLQAVGMKDGSS